MTGRDVNHLIIDYVVICEKRGELLDFAAFIELWTVADEITAETLDTSAPQSRS